MAKPGKGKKKAPRVRHALVILGMHRSGTSALAGLMHHLGATLPVHLMPPTDQNKRGYFESTAMQKFNDALLQEAGSSWKDWRAMSANWTDAASSGKQRVEATALIKSEFPRAALPLLKDPRICRMVPFWSEAIKKARFTPLFILTHRNPIEVADSLHTRDKIPHAVTLLLWLRHVLDAEAETRGQTRAFSSFDRVLADSSGTADKISKALGFDWPIAFDTVRGNINDFLTADLRHVTRSAADVTTDPHLASWIDNVFAIMERWAEKGERKSDYKELDQIYETFNAASQAFEPLIRAKTESENALTARQKASAEEKLEAQKAAETARAQYLKLAELWEDGQRETRQATKEMNETLTRTQNVLAQKDKALHDRTTALEEATSQLEQHKADLKDARSTAADLESRLQGSEAQAQSLRDELAHTQSALEQRRTESEDTARTGKLLSEELAQTKRQLDVLSSDYEDSIRELGQLARLVPDSEEHQQAALNEQRADLENEHSSLHKTLKAVQADLTDRLAALDAQLAGSKSWAAQLQDRTKAQERELGQIAKMLSVAESDRDSHLGRLQELEQEQGRLRSEMERLAHDNHVLMSSTSWKLTAPLRRMIGVFRRG